MRSNCVIWAWALWARRRATARRRGRPFTGAVYWRISRWGPFPHCLYGETVNGRLRMVSYKPLHPRHKPVPPLVFTGASRWGDL